MDYTSPYQRDEVWHLLNTRGTLAGDQLGHLDLSELNLAAFEARESTLRDTCLVKASLPGGRLLACTLLGADLRQASLREGLIEACRLDQARLMELELVGGTLADSTLQGCYLSRLRGSDALYARVDFEGCDFTAADLSGSRFLHCRFQAPPQLGGANLARVNLSGAVLIDCDLEGVNLREANLSGATLISCDLRGANATEARLEGASFIGCNAEGIRLVDSHREGIRHAATRFEHART